MDETNHLPPNLLFGPYSFQALDRFQNVNAETHASVTVSDVSFWENIFVSQIHSVSVKGACVCFGGT